MKKEELIKGNWYVGVACGNTWLFKFDHIDGDYVYNTRAATPSDGYIGGYGHITPINLREATEQEVKQMFPKEIYTNKKSMKQEIEYYEVIKKVPLSYTVGDKVSTKKDFEQCAQYPEYFSPVYKQQFKKGDYITDKRFPDSDILQIAAITKTEIKYVHGGWDYINALGTVYRLATPEEIEQAQQIKIGSYNVEFLSKTKIKIGCSEYTETDVLNCQKVLKLARCKSINFDENELTLEIVEKILKRL